MSDASAPRRVSFDLGTATIELSVVGRTSFGGDEVLPLFEHWFPASAAASEALGVLVDAYDRPFVGGYITTNGATQGRLLLLHP